MHLLSFSVANKGLKPLPEVTLKAFFGVFLYSLLFVSLLFISIQLSFCICDSSPFASVDCTLNQCKYKASLCENNGIISIVFSLPLYSEELRIGMTPCSRFHLRVMWKWRSRWSANWNVSAVVVYGYSCAASVSVAQIMHQIKLATAAARSASVKAN